ncbi:MAG TPA: Xaa-Pro peptidase family protein [Solirubrobacterales bacterium]|nr:Xaa-Pro peptidase family protein [Solirubrobacterales bacterium]
MTTIPTDELERRHAKLRAAAAEAGFDAVLAYSTCKTQANVRWLTGYFTRFAGWQHVQGEEYAMFGSCACLLPVDGEPLLRSDQSWDAPRVEEMSPFADAGSTMQLGTDLGRVIAERGYKRVAIDNWHIFPVVHYLALKEAAPDVELVDSRIISEARRVKSPYEIERIRRVEEIADAAAIAGMEATKVGVSEYDAALAAETVARELGDLEAGGNPIIGSTKSFGTGVCLPSRDVVLKSGEWMIFDVLPRFEGYCGDIARMRLAGDESDLDPKLKHYYEATLLINREAIKAIKPGISTGELNDIANEVAEQEGVAEIKSPLLGHATGLDIHDVPDFWNDRSPLQAGEVITIEPCLGIPGEVGTRIEDVILVTEDGYEELTKAPRELVVS